MLDIGNPAGTEDGWRGSGSGLGCGVQGLGFRVYEGLGLRVQGRVYGERCKYYHCLQRLLQPMPLECFD